MEYVEIKDKDDSSLYPNTMRLFNIGEKIEPKVVEKDIRKVELVTFGIDKLDKDSFMSVTNEFMHVKPYGGLWASRYQEECYILYSEWCDFAFNEMGIKYSKACKFKLKQDARVYTIDSYEDLVVLIHQHGYTAPNNKSYIDFGLARMEYDVIEFTDKGQRETRYSEPGLYGWDVECVLILNFDCIDLESQSSFVPEYPEE